MTVRLCGCADATPQRRLFDRVGRCLIRIESPDTRKIDTPVGPLCPLADLDPKPHREMRVSVCECVFVCVGNMEDQSSASRGVNTKH